MPRLSFRTKLIVAMTLVVAGVTIATVLLTQRRVQAAYQRLFEEQFNMQIKYFSESRLRQLDAAAKRCEAVAQSVRVVAALEEGDPDLVYDNVLTELRELYKPQEFAGNLAPQGPRPQPAGPGRAPGPGTSGKSSRERPLETYRRAVVSTALSTALGAKQPIIRILDAAGNVLEPRDPRAGLLKKTSGAKRGEELRLFLKLDQPLGDVLQQLETGYMDFEGPGTTNQLHEIIVTPIQREDSRKVLGALVLGFPVGDFGEKAMYGFSEKTLLSGIWLGGKIFSETIPKSVRAEVARQVASEVEDNPSFTSRKPVLVDGVPHRLFFKVLNPESPFPPAAQVCLYSMTEVIAEQERLRNMEIGAGSLALLLGVGFILFISHGFSRPIEQLALATQRIREGDFTVKIPVTSRDEIGALASSFNEMSEELALKERYKSVLAQVTDKEVADQLISGQMSLGGEVRQVSVLFCDIRGFTGLTENMPPVDVITMLNEHMTAMNRIVHQHYGVVDKFVGDLIMAVFGAPKSYGNDALHAVKCARDMIAERRRLNSISRYRFEIGIGVATGEVVAGCMGSEDRLNYTVLGERVNLASRLCSKAAGTELLIDENTYVQLPPDLLAEPTEPLALKGFSLPTSAYRLAGTAPIDSDVAMA